MVVGPGTIPKALSQTVRSKNVKYQNLLLFIFIFKGTNVLCSAREHKIFFEYTQDSAAFNCPACMELPDCEVTFYKFSHTQTSFGSKLDWCSKYDYK